MNDRTTPLPPLNCNGCRTCCLGDTVPLLPGDNPAAYKTKLEGGRRVLARKADGNCVYLGPKGCKIHGRAPQACRALDCRRFALLLDEMSAAQQAHYMAQPRHRVTIEEGRRRLNASRTS